MFNNSYDEYKNILATLKRSGRLCLFEEASRKDDFIVLRHDVEFSLAKALRMAQIEKETGVKSTYFVQIGNPAYNAISDEGKEIIKKINLLGHDIGLHYRQEEKENERKIASQIKTLEQEVGVKVRTFSTHRPKKGTDYDKYDIPGITNAYSKQFFTLTDDLENVDAKYISDSKYNWNYGYPSEQELKQRKRVQILVHPFQWFNSQTSMAECFRELAREKKRRLYQTFGEEFSRYKEVSNVVE